MSNLDFLGDSSWREFAPLGIAGIIVWTLWLYRAIGSRFYRPVVNNFRTTTSVVVPSYREDPEILIQCLKTWLVNDPTEIIIVVDAADVECHERLARVDDPRLRTIIMRHEGKRSALGVGIRAATGEIVVLSDSDTLWRGDLLAAVQMPFIDPTVGAVGTQQNVYQRKTSIWRRIADWMVNLRYYDYVPAMSRKGAVICISGRTAAYRRSVIVPVLPNLEHEFFLGRRCVAGDDGRLTWLVLGSGYKTVHQSTARALSMFPDTFRAFCKQRVRWSRNSARTYLTALWKGWLWRVPFVSKVTVLQILLTPVTMALTLGYLFFSRLELTQHGIVLAVGWLLIGRGIRGYSHLRRHPLEIFLLPLYSLVVIFVALPIKAYAIVTMNKQGWLTRSVESVGGEGQSAATLIAEAADVATLPIAFRKFVAVGIGVCVTSLALGTAAIPVNADDASPPAPAVVTEQDAELQATVLAAEDRRLIEIRTVTSLARWQGKNWKTPYRLGTAAGYTLVLTPRSEAYTVDDLLQLAPQTFLRMSDGSYLLSEHIIVMARATLRLSAPGGMTLRLASGHAGFSTIVSLGGELQVIGEEGAAVNITSWDATAGTVDEMTTDGRAYIRAIGGQFEANYMTLAHLGFWSGRTGGLALTGTDRPNTGAIESLGPDDVVESGPASLLDGVTWQPAGPLEAGQQNLNLDYTVPALDYVSTRMTNVTVDHNAFGLFVSGANGVQVSDSTFNDNLLGGVVFHRYVTNGVISRTTSSRNQGDGFTLARATTGIVISESTASLNAGSGFSLDGRSLADGPSAVGASLRSYGNNSVSNSTATDNGHYGIELLGGFNVGVQNNIVDGQDMGIMVNGPAQRVSITGNTVLDSARHGVAVVDGVTESTVTGNVVDGSSTGVYLRDSTSQIKGNTIEDAESHGVSLVGSVDGSEVSYNVLAGSGASALDTRRSQGEVSLSTNNMDGWHDTTPWYFWFKKLLHPMSALWTVLALLIIVSAIRSRRGNGAIEHPYAHQMAHHGHLPVPQPRIVEESDDSRSVYEPV